MKTAALLVVTLCATATAYADFSYTTTRKIQGPAASEPAVTKLFYKGQKMMTDSGAAATIFDFDAQTITVLNKGTQNYTVIQFGEIGRRHNSPASTPKPRSRRPARRRRSTVSAPAKSS